MEYYFGQFCLDLQSRKLFKNQTVISDDQKIIELLFYLCESYPEAVDKQLLIEKLWPNQVVTDWSLSRLVSDTRQLLGDTGKEQGLIQTIRGRGFRLNELVTQKNSETSLSTQSDSRNISHKRILSGLAIVGLFALGIGIFQFYQANSQPPETQTISSSDSMRIAVLPIYVDSSDAIDDWVSIGLMSLTSEQLDKYSSINTIPVSNVISQLASLLEQKEPPQLDNAFFNSTCLRLGCSHIIAIQYRLEDNKPVLGYQILTKSGLSRISEFMETDVIDTADMLLDHLATDLLPKDNTRLSLSDTFTTNNKANRDYAIGVHELFSGDIKNAKQYIQLALERKPDFFWAKAYMAEIEYRAGQLDKALEIIQQLKEKSLQPREAYFLDHLLSNIYYSQGKLKESMNVTQKLIESETIKDKPFELARELMNMGSGLQAIGELNQAEEYLNRSIEQYRLAKFVEGEGKALFNLANVFLSKDQKHKAIDYYQKAREIFKRFNMTGYALMAKHQIATTSLSTGRYQYAENELRLLTEEYKKVGDEEGELIAYYDLAVVSIEKKDFSEGSNRLERLITRLDSTSYDYLKQQSYRTAVKAALMLGENQKAFRLYTKITGEWVDSRPAYALIPAHLILNEGKFDQAVSKANEIKVKLADNWTDAHQKVFQQIETAASQRKVLPINY